MLLSNAMLPTSYNIWVKLLPVDTWLRGLQNYKSHSVSCTLKAQLLSAGASDPFSVVGHTLLFYTHRDWKGDDDIVHYCELNVEYDYVYEQSFRTRLTQT